MGFTSTDLIAALQRSRPGELLKFDEVDPGELIAAVDGISDGPAADAVSDLAAHVQVHRLWWGVRLEVDHEGMGLIKAAGGGVAGLLVAAGVPVFVGAIVGAVVAIWGAFDQGNGVIAFVTWSGVHWFATR